jgi:dihydrofolate reductase
MRKLIAAINMTLDGYCDHTAITPDDEFQDHYNELLRGADTILWGRITYELMEEYWPLLVKDPSGNKPMDDFAVLADNLTKILYSRTRSTVTWKNTFLKKEIVKEEIAALKKQPGKNILAGSRSVIARLSQLDLIDEYQLCICPTILGKGLPLFEDFNERIDLKLTNTKVLGAGAIVLYYEPGK